MKAYIWNVLIWIDQGGNVIFAPLLNCFLRPVVRFGDPDETLSSVFGKNVSTGSCLGCKVMCKVLHWLDPNHCAKSVEADEGSRSLH